MFWVNAKMAARAPIAVQSDNTVCDECGSEGKYARNVLIERYGADPPMPDILNRITDCTRNRPPRECHSVT